eukprot:GEMP01010411.1.p1 GENE.GEMP01010411.1~~GEMP01010411.1.p1  ORF type:complete len:433 (+),score=108.62 GEMP01010411.1:40-1299(+)
MAASSQTANIGDMVLPPLPWPPSYAIRHAAVAVCLLEVEPDPVLARVDPTGNVKQYQTALFVEFPLGPQGTYILTSNLLVPTVECAKRTKCYFGRLAFRMPPAASDEEKDDAEDDASFTMLDDDPSTEVKEEQLLEEVKGFEVAIETDRFITNILLDFTLLPITVPAFAVWRGPAPIEVDPCTMSVETTVCAFYHDPYLKAGQVQNLSNISFPVGSPCFLCLDEESGSTTLDFAGMVTAHGMNRVEPVLKWLATQFPDVQEAACKRLCYAARLSNSRMMHGALESGAQVSYREETLNLQTALHQSARPETGLSASGVSASDVLECTEMLLKHKADVMQRDGKSWSCIQQHAYAGSAEQLALLLHVAPAECLSDTTPLGQTLFDLACGDEDKHEALERTRKRMETNRAFFQIPEEPSEDG